MRARALVLFVLALTSPSWAGAAKPKAEKFSYVGAAVTVNFAGPTGASSPNDVVTAIKQAMDEVAGFYGGRFPVPKLTVDVAPHSREDGTFGREFMGERIELYLGAKMKPDALLKDWILVHEMFHLGFPGLPENQNWMGEGLSTYLEPLARARAGHLTEQQVWADFVFGLKKAIPTSDKMGMDAVRDYRRLYWGGCLYWLLVDLEIREKTKNAKSLDTALRAVLAAGGDDSMEWTLAEFLAIADKAVAMPVFTKWYRTFGPKPSSFDLPAFFARLGVEEKAEQIVFHDDAPLATLRRALTERKRR